ncbi:MAG: DUF3857 domain-containing protein, partial [Flammeovirgaceae bacterium]
VAIPYYSYKNYYTCNAIKAQSYTLEDGKIVKTKIAKSDIFEKQEDEYYTTKSFAIPNVSVGSIIEYTYTLRSDQITYLDDWLFHNDIPTLYSGFSLLSIPANLDFRFMMDGDKVIRKYRNTTSPISHWSLTNTPPIRNEPMVANPLNYANKIRFQLAGYRTANAGMNGYSGSSTENYHKLLNDWPQIVKEQLWENASFNHPFLHKKQFSDNIAQVVSGVSDAKERMKLVYAYCQRYFKWSGDHSIFFGKDEKQKVTKGLELDSGPLNLYLVAMLKEAGLKATPVLISTRRHGKVYRDSRFLSQFNHVIAHVDISGKPYFLDATIPYQSYQFLPVKDMNVLGIRADKTAPKWVNLPMPKQNNSILQYTIDLSASGKRSYQINAKYKGVYQVEERALLQRKGESAYIGDKFSAFKEGFTIDSFQVKNAANLEQPLSMSCSLSSNEEMEEEDADILYVPLFQEGMTTNPFQNEVRYYPVEIAFARRFITTVTVKLPEGYEVEEKPENKRIELVNKMGYFDYKITLAEGEVNVSTTLFMKHGKIKPRNYEALKGFFTDVIGKMQEQLVLKRKQG